MVSTVSTEEAGLGELIKALSASPIVLAELRELKKEITAQLSHVTKAIAVNNGNTDGWLDAKSAAKYMGISAGSFDKYRYLTNPRIKGYNLDGKTLYKKSDLDDFVKLYEIKCKGLA